MILDGIHIIRSNMNGKIVGIYYPLVSSIMAGKSTSKWRVLWENQRTPIGKLENPRCLLLGTSLNEVADCPSDVWWHQRVSISQIAESQLHKRINLALLEIIEFLYSSRWWSMGVPLVRAVSIQNIGMIMIHQFGVRGNTLFSGKPICLDSTGLLLPVQQFLAKGEALGSNERHSPWHWAKPVVQENLPGCGELLDICGIIMG